MKHSVIASWLPCGERTRVIPAHWECYEPAHAPKPFVNHPWANPMDFNAQGISRFNRLRALEKKTALHGRCSLHARRIPFFVEIDAAESVDIDFLVIKPGNRLGIAKSDWVIYGLFRHH